MNSMNFLQKKKTAIALFLIVLALLCFDIIHGLKTKQFDNYNFLELIYDSKHEILTILLTSLGLYFLWSWYSEACYEIENLSDEIITIEEDLSMSKEELKSYLSKSKEYLEKRMDSWLLSKSEKEVCVLLLKGHSTKVIANIRSTSERTVRNQASIIYDKADVTGRHELSAYFLRSLLG